MNRAVAETLTVHVPFQIVKRGGCKKVKLPIDAPAVRFKPDSTLVKALARAFRWKKMLDSGEFITIAELAAREKIAPSYLTRILQLTLLAPNTVEAIVEGRITAGLAELLQPFDPVWTSQNCSMAG